MNTAALTDIALPIAQASFVLTHALPHPAHRAVSYCNLVGGAPAAALHPRDVFWGAAQHRGRFARCGILLRAAPRMTTRLD